MCLRRTRPSGLGPFEHVLPTLRHKVSASAVRCPSCRGPTPPDGPETVAPPPPADAPTLIRRTSSGSDDDATMLGISRERRSADTAGNPGRSSETGLRIAPSDGETRPALPVGEAETTLGAGPASDRGVHAGTYRNGPDDLTMAAPASSGVYRDNASSATRGHAHEDRLLVPGEPFGTRTTSSVCWAPAGWAWSFRRGTRSWG